MTTRPHILTAAALWWLSIAVLIPYGRPVVNVLRERGWLGPSVSLGLIAITAAAIGWVLLLLRRGELRRRQVVVAVVATGLLLAAAQILERAEERWHVAQYGVLAVLIWGGLSLGGWRRPVIAVVACAALGWADEGVQYLLPDRVYDLRDVALNGFSGLLGVGVAEAVRGLRAPPGKET